MDHGDTATQARSITVAFSGSSGSGSNGNGIAAPTPRRGFGTPGGNGVGSHPGGGSAVGEPPSDYLSEEMRTLILAPTGRDAPLAAQTLRASGLLVTICHTPDELTRHIQEGAGVSVVALEALTPPVLDHLDRTLAKQPPWSDLPLIVLTGSGRSAEATEALLQASDGFANATFLERPLRVATLVRAVRVALRARRRQYEIRGHLRERERAAAERLALIEQQRTLLRDVLTSVTEGRLSLCDTPDDLPAPLPAREAAVALFENNLHRLRRRTLHAARLCGLGHERTTDLLTAVNEAAMNAVRHGGGGTARVGADAKHGQVQVWIEDRGGGIDVSHLPKATLERGYSSAGTFGHGFWLMLNMADRTYLLTGPGGTTVVLEQNARPPDPLWLRRSVSAS